MFVINFIILITLTVQLLVVQYRRGEGWVQSWRGEWIQTQRRFVELNFPFLTMSSPSAQRRELWTRIMALKMRSMCWETELRRILDCPCYDHLFLVISDEVLLRMRSGMTVKKLFSSNSSTGTVTTNGKSVISLFHSTLHPHHIHLVKLSYSVLIFTVLAIQFVGPEEFRSASKLTSSSVREKMSY